MHAKFLTRMASCAKANISMKARQLPFLITFWIIALCSITLSGCDKNNLIFPAQAMEQLSGVVTNEEGIALEGVLMTAYLPSGDVYNHGTDDKVYTDKDGRYCFSGVSHQLTEPLLLTIIAEDTLGVYEKQQKQGKIEYDTNAPIGYITGTGHLDFVLKKIRK